MSPRFLLCLALLVLAAFGACRERQDLAGDTVRVSLPDRRVELDVISCGLDDDVFVLGASSADAFVQLLLVIEDEQIDLDRSAVSVETAQDGLLGAGSAAALQLDAAASGEITSATIRGDRIDVEADAIDLSGGGAGGTVQMSIDARCPAVEEFT